MISQFVFGMLVMLLIENLLNLDAVDTRLYTILIVLLVVVFDIVIKVLYGGM